ncbi:methyltransferase type 11 [Brevundimonas sp. S30B]|uniref:methyltransferase type 11 n=1 Tax=unclassified Brevundimonas TaxID=2622653 RepID=UPI001071C3C3|nr:MULTISPECIES: methyltransferase type 11 [unclassified Brevundimonas]QBX38688.1 methyltransferase type 11 [Brevundimonas sp. MF30-B]TFW01279.1 methyltransferase type 11 [Brevundimonas sp. S30B]
MTRVAASLAALIASLGLGACDGDGVRISSTTTRTDDGGPLKVVDALQCPQTLDVLTRKGSASADGASCTYAGPRGSEVTLHLVKLNGASPDTVLREFETRLSGDMPAAAAKIDSENARAQAAAARADADAARADADAAREDARAAALEIQADDATGTASVRGPGMDIRADKENASVRLPGLRIETQGDTASVRIGGLNITSNDGKGTTEIRSSSSTSGPGVSVNARDNVAEVRTIAGGEATRATYVLSDSRAQPGGWGVVGYEARGPAGGPLVIATVRARERKTDGVFEAARALVTLNTGR